MIWSFENNEIKSDIVTEWFYDKKWRESYFGDVLAPALFCFGYSCMSKTEKCLYFKKNLQRFQQSKFIHIPGIFSVNKAIEKMNISFLEKHNWEMRDLSCSMVSLSNVPRICRGRLWKSHSLETLMPTFIEWKFLSKISASEIVFRLIIPLECFVWSEIILFSNTICFLKTS